MLVIDIPDYETSWGYPSNEYLLGVNYLLLESFGVVSHVDDQFILVMHIWVEVLFGEKLNAVVEFV